MELKLKLENDLKDAMRSGDDVEKKLHPHGDRCHKISPG